MSASALTVDLLLWIDARPRRYDEAIEAWKTSCPRLSIWDDAVIDGLVRVERSPGVSPTVALTELGHALLAGPHHASHGPDRAVVDE